MKKTFIAMIAAAALIVPSAAFAGDANKGKDLFDGSAGCKTCHKTDSSKLVGPGLAGVAKRRSAEFFNAWLNDPQATWEANGADVQALKKEVKKEGKPKTAMKIKRKLAADEIADIIAYLNTL